MTVGEQRKRDAEEEKMKQALLSRSRATAAAAAEGPATSTTTPNTSQSEVDRVFAQRYKVTKNELDFLEGDSAKRPVITGHNMAGFQSLKGARGGSQGDDGRIAHRLQIVKQMNREKGLVEDGFWDSYRAKLGPLQKRLFDARKALMGSDIDAPYTGGTRGDRG